MPRPEEFSKHLENNLEKSKKAKAATNQERIKTKQGLQQEEEQTKLATAESIRQANQAVLKLDSQLPIGEYIKVLKSRVVSLESVRKWGPKNGEIDYAFPFQLKIGKRVVKKSQLPPGRNLPGGGVDDYGWRMWRNVFGVRLMHDGYIVIGQAERVFPLDSINPRYWLSGNSFYINSEEGLKQFTQELTNFYLEQKA